MSEVLVTLWGSDDPDNPFVDAFPIGWTPEKTKVIVQVTQETGVSFWAMSPDGTEKIRLTENIPIGSFSDGAGGTYEFLQGSAAFVINEDLSTKHLFVVRQHNAADQEYVYADGTISTDATLHDRDPDTHERIHPTLADPGPRMNFDFALRPAELLHCASGDIADLSVIVEPDDLPPNMRWSPMVVYPSPDGSKVFMYQFEEHPTTQRWLVGLGLSIDIPTEGTFRIVTGMWGSAEGIPSFPIDFDATAEEVWSEMRTGQAEWGSVIGHELMGDPRDYGTSGDPWDDGPLPYQGVTVNFHDLTTEGVWADIDNHYLIGDGWLNYGILPYHSYLTTSDPYPTVYLADGDGSGLSVLDFDAIKWNFPGGWIDTTRFHGIASPADGVGGFARWFVYDTSANTVVYPLDYSDDLGESGFGPMQSVPWVSPNGEKVIWMLNTGGHQELWMGNFDGSTVSDAVKIYDQDLTVDHTDDHSYMFLSSTGAWNFSSTKFVMADPRNGAPMWLVDAATGDITSVFEGSGSAYIQEVVQFDE